MESVTVAARLLAARFCTLPFCCCPPHFRPTHPNVTIPHQLGTSTTGISKTMVKQHSQVINFLMGICDQLVVAAAWGAAYVFRFTFFPYDKGTPRLRDLLTNLVVVMLV